MNPVINYLKFSLICLLEIGYFIDQCLILLHVIKTRKLPHSSEVYLLFLLRLLVFFHWIVRQELVSILSLQKFSFVNYLDWMKLLDFFVIPDVVQDPA